MINFIMSIELSMEIIYQTLLIHTLNILNYGDIVLNVKNWWKLAGNLMGKLFYAEKKNHVAKSIL